VIAPYRPKYFETSGGPEGRGRQLVQHPLRHHRLLRPRRCLPACRCRRRGKICSARVQRPGRLSRPRPARRSATRRDRGEPRARRHARQLEPGIDFSRALKTNRPICAADLLRARAVGRDSDHVRLRLSIPCAEVQGQSATACSSSPGRYNRAALLMGLVKNGPPSGDAKKVLDYLMSDRARRSGRTPICADPGGGE